MRLGKVYCSAGGKMKGGKRERLSHTHYSHSCAGNVTVHQPVWLSVCFLVGSSRVMANDFHSFVFDFPNCNVSISVCRLSVSLCLLSLLFLCIASLVFRLCDECATFVKLAWANSSALWGRKGGVAAALNQLESLYILAESHRQRCNPLAVN